MVDAATVKLRVDEPAPVIDVGLKPTVTPVGAPDEVSAIAELKPPVTLLVMVVLPEPPWAIETDVGDAERLKPGCVVVEPVSAASKPVFGLPQPVTRSYPETAE